MWNCFASLLYEEKRLKRALIKPKFFDSISVGDTINIDGVCVMNVINVFEISRMVLVEIHHDSSTIEPFGGRYAGYKKHLFKQVGKF